MQSLLYATALVILVLFVHGRGPLSKWRPTLSNLAQGPTWPWKWMAHISVCNGLLTKLIP